MPLIEKRRDERIYEVSEDTAGNLTDRQLLESIARPLTAVEEYIEGKQRDTQPLLGEIRATVLDIAERMTRVEAKLQRIEGTLQVMAGDALEVRTEQRILERRVTDLERPKQ